MVEENEKGRGGGRERGAHESQEVVVIVTESLYLSIRSISGILLLWKKTREKKRPCESQRAFSQRLNYQPTHMH